LRGRGAGKRSNLQRRSSGFSAAGRQTASAIPSTLLALADDVIE
jgi:hypothetical protein